MHDSIIKYHRVAKLWADEVRQEASSSRPFKQEAPEMVENIINLSSQGTFKQHIEINPAGDDALLQHLGQIKAINREACY